jgi:Zn-dependent membrane protease YugP
MYYYGLDLYYFLLVIPALILAFGAQILVKSTYKRYSGKPNSKGITGAQAAQAVLKYYGINDVVIQPIGGTLTDNFNPKNNVISLSTGVYSSNSIAAVGIACHEAGHAAQHAENYKPIQVRNSIVPICNIGSHLGIPLAILGAFLTPYWAAFSYLVYIGLALYAAVFVFHLVTLPVEFNASRRALKVITESGLLYGDEYSGARKVLTAAAMTYVASMLVALANLLRLLLRFAGNRKR